MVWLLALGAWVEWAEWGLVEWLLVEWVALWLLRPPPCPLRDPFASAIDGASIAASNNAPAILEMDCIGAFATVADVIRRFSI